MGITLAPSTPVSAKTYAKHGLPWYDLYDEEMGTVTPTETLKGVKSVAELDEEQDEMDHHEGA